MLLWVILFLFLISQKAHKITLALWKTGVQSRLRVRPSTEELQLHADSPAARPDAEQCFREGREPREHPRALLV